MTTEQATRQMELITEFLRDDRCYECSPATGGHHQFGCAHPRNSHGECPLCEYFD